MSKNAPDFKCPIGHIVKFSECRSKWDYVRRKLAHTLYCSSHVELDTVTGMLWMVVFTIIQEDIKAPYETPDFQEGQQAWHDAWRKFGE
jgi:hypothetical protein